MNIYKPIVHTPHTLKYPNLERHVYVIFWVTMIVTLCVAIIFGRNDARLKREEQHRQEQKAIWEHHAVEVQTQDYVDDVHRQLRDAIVGIVRHHEYHRRMRKL